VRELLQSASRSGRMRVEDVDELLALLGGYMLSKVFEQTVRT
jgi:hypothetical protein